MQKAVKVKGVLILWELWQNFAEISEILLKNIDIKICRVDGYKWQYFAEISEILLKTQTLKFLVQTFVNGNISPNLQNPAKNIDILKFLV